jgi:hypothetical protein
MSYPFNDYYSHGLKNGELLSKIVVYEFDHITKKDSRCMMMISFSQPGLMGSMVQ